MAIAALVLGIVGLILSLVPCLGMYALPLTLIAIILGAMGMKKVPGKGMAIAGLICGVLGTAIAGWWLYAYLTVKNQLNDPNSKFNKDLQKNWNEATKDKGSADVAPTPEAPEAPAGSAAGSAATP
jgi:hypothetical protein